MKIQDKTIHKKKYFLPFREGSSFHKIEFFTNLEYLLSCDLFLMTTRTLGRVYELSYIFTPSHDLNQAQKTRFENLN